ncbi:MAG: VOC family protein [Pseudomonadota bacterium]
MVRLDHLTVVAPTLREGAAHLRDCLDLDLPFGTRHLYMGTHNHRLLLGRGVYLEVIALDPDGNAPGRPRWFGLDDQDQVRSDWEDGRRLRAWVASTDAMGPLLACHHEVFGEKVPLPSCDPTFDFAIPADGSLPLNGAAPSLIDRRGIAEPLSAIPDLGARLLSLTLVHPNPAAIVALYDEWKIDRPPSTMIGDKVRYRAEIETPDGVKLLT